MDNRRKMCGGTGKSLLGLFVPVGNLEPQAVWEAVFEIVITGGFSGEFNSIYPECWHEDFFPHPYVR